MGAKKKDDGWPFYGMLRKVQLSKEAVAETAMFLDLGEGDPFGGFSSASITCLATLRFLSSSQLAEYFPACATLIEIATQRHFRSELRKYIKNLRANGGAEVSLLPPNFEDVDVVNLINNWEKHFPDKKHPIDNTNLMPSRVVVWVVCRGRDYSKLTHNEWVAASIIVLIEICRVTRVFKRSEQSASDLLLLGKQLSDIQYAVLVIEQYLSFLSDDSRVKAAVRQHAVERARQSSDKAHERHRAFKKKVFEWMDENEKKYPSLEKCAEVILTSKLVAMSRATVRGWLTEWKKISSVCV